MDNDMTITGRHMTTNLRVATSEVQNRSLIFFVDKYCDTLWKNSIFGGQLFTCLVFYCFLISTVYPPPPTQRSVIPNIMSILEICEGLMARSLV